MLANLQHHLTEMANKDTAFVVLMYSVSAMFVAVAFHNIARAFFPVKHEYNRYD